MPIHTSILSALTNPKTQASAFMLLEMATAAIELVRDLDKPEMTEDEKVKAWARIKEMNEQADAMLKAAITSHPAWDDDETTS